MERPIVAKCLFRFTPFNMSYSEELNQNEDLQYWIGEMLSDILGADNLKTLGYSGAQICEDVDNGTLNIALTFRADNAIVRVRNAANGKSNPMIRKELRKLKNRFFFGEVEDSSYMAKTTFYHYKQKKDGEIKEDRLQRETDIDVLRVVCNPILTLCNLLNHSPEDETLEIRMLPIQINELSQFNYSAPEEYSNMSPCRINVVYDNRPEYDHFDPDSVEQNLYAVARIESDMRKRVKRAEKTIAAASDRSYEKAVKEKRKERKTKKYKKNKEAKRYGKL